MSMGVGGGIYRNVGNYLNGFGRTKVLNFAWIYCIVGVEVEQRLEESGGGVPVGDVGVGGEGAEVVELGGFVGLVGQVRLVGWVIEQFFIVFVELLLAAAEFVGVVGFEGVPCHLGGPVEGVPAVVEESLAVVIPAGDHGALGAATEAVSVEVGDVLDVALWGGHHHAAVA